MSNNFYYSGTLEEFQSSQASDILGLLSQENKFELTIEQRNAWLAQIPILQEHLSALNAGHLFFEFTIPRMGKRCDVILIFQSTVFVIEFKVGATSYEQADIRQTVDYALDLKNFHEASHDRRIIPILVSTEAKSVPNKLVLAEDQISNCQLTSGENLKDIILHSADNTTSIDPEEWSQAAYRPTPTIIEAARVLYDTHSVADISRNDASAKNLGITTTRIEEIIKDAQQHSKKVICFITGVPGAGKTLAGLNIATSMMKNNDEEHSTFLSGNGPLVEVLQTALARDLKAREGVTMSEASRRTKAFIQNIHHFRDAYLADKHAPSDHVVIFDEAQRAWTKDKASKFMREKKGQSDFNQSEPQFLIDVMGRHQDWCVIIALIGGGQEINDGEAGLPEWFNGIKQSSNHWHTYYSPFIDQQEYTLGLNLQELLPDRSYKEEELHLSVSLRSFRAEKLSAFVNALISRKPALAKELLTDIADNFPIRLTRDLEKAKNWIELQKRRGNERSGIVASASAKRLAPYSIQMKVKAEPANWFLNDEDDIRSSSFMEVAASQFDIQGLELDWTILGWDADLRAGKEEWEHFTFKGTKWQRVNKEIDQLYLRNAYRVLLTRARQGMVIFIPEGDTGDRTRNPEFYHPIVGYLQECGIREL